MILIPVKYHNKNYPDGVFPQIDEIAGNFDSKAINMEKPYSLHTEYSYMKRDFDSELLDGLDELKNANKNGIPQLWKSIKWSEEYALFIERLIGSSIPPEVIEIHPPFKDYCDNITVFWDRYIAFYKHIISKFPTTKIIIENRCGTMYTGSEFLISTCKDVIELCQFLADKHNELGIIIDYPQLFSAEKIRMDNVNIEKILQFNLQLKQYSSTVWAIHLWGKRKSKNNRWAPHSGDLNSFFSNDNEKKELFLNSMKDVFNDDISRYFVPEVNTSEDDLKSIVNDLILSGVIFVQPAFNNHLIAIDWEEQIPKFVLHNHLNNSVWKCNAIGEFSFLVGSKRYCIGNKDVISHQYVGCPNHAVPDERSVKCFSCDKSDQLKYCVRCTGDQCYVSNQDVLKRCNQEHFVYLAFFPNDIVKVGVAHDRRKYTRLYEQGALYSFIIASCKSGKIARELESNIKKIGIIDKVSSNHKIRNLINFNAEYAKKKLENVYGFIMKEIGNTFIKNVNFIVPPEIVKQKGVISVLDKFQFDENLQLSLWNYTDAEDLDKIDVEILDEIDNFHGKIIAFVGTIAILRREDKYYLFDFKNLIGREIHIVTYKSASPIEICPPRFGQH